MRMFIYLIFILFFSCGKVDCNELHKFYKEGDCKIIVSDIPIPESRHRFYIKGKTIITNEDTIYDEENRWYCEFYKYIGKGDTIRKQKGTTVFEIHKRDTVLTLYLECIGKVYK